MIEKIIVMVIFTVFMLYLGCQFYKMTDFLTKDSK